MSARDRALNGQAQPGKKLTPTNQPAKKMTQTPTYVSTTSSVSARIGASPEIFAALRQERTALLARRDRGAVIALCGPIVLSVGLAVAAVASWSGRTGTFIGLSGLLGCVILLIVGITISMTASTAAAENEGTAVRAYIAQLIQLLLDGPLTQQEACAALGWDPRHMEDMLGRDTAILTITGRYGGPLDLTPNARRAAEDARKRARDQG